MPVTNLELLSQIHLSGEAACANFQPHPLKANICTACSRLVNKHSAESIPGDDCLLRALEFSQSREKIPSCIVERSEGQGGLWHGGFKAVMNHQFLQEKGIRHIVNTAKGLEMFGPKYMGAVERNKNELGISFLELDWEDTTSFSITDDSLSQCCRFIHEARAAGESVLVHCAQGKSRSATAVVAHLMVSSGLCYAEALDQVQAQRKMAEPNPHFQLRLQQFEQSATLGQLRIELPL